VLLRLQAQPAEVGFLVAFLAKSFLRWMAR
jgi:hypothetical protein